jgi:phage gp46-like protein
MTCNVGISGLKRLFWSHNPCGTRKDECGNDCSRFALRLQDKVCDTECGNTSCTPNQPKTIATSDWVRGLALNILMTHGQAEDSDCGQPVGTRGAHWSDSFTGAKSGSLLHLLPSAKNVATHVQNIQLAVDNALQKLVTYQVASSVVVVAAYVGGQRYSVDVTIYGMDTNRSAIKLNGSRLGNSFLWS